MEDTIETSDNGHIEVRYNKYYSISMFAGTVIFVLISFLLAGKQWSDKALFLIFGLVTLLNGLFSVIMKVYIGYYPKEKELIFHHFWLLSRTLRFDRLYFIGKDLYRKTKGKTRFVNVVRNQCVKEDFEKFTDEVKKQDSLQGS